MPSANKTDATETIVAPRAETLLEIELAMSVLRRRIDDLNDRLYRDLRPLGVYL